MTLVEVRKMCMGGVWSNSGGQMNNEQITEQIIPKPMMDIWSRLDFGPNSVRISFSRLISSFTLV